MVNATCVYACACNRRSFANKKASFWIKLLIETNILVFNWMNRIYWSWILWDWFQIWEQKKRKLSVIFLLRTETTTERRVGYTLKQVSEKFLLSDENIIATTKTTCWGLQKYYTRSVLAIFIVKRCQQWDDNSTILEHYNVC